MKTRPNQGTFLCPNCGEPVPARAAACPACGSDEETGWSPEALFEGVTVPAGKKPATGLLFSRFRGRGKLLMLVLGGLTLLAFVLAFCL